MTFDTEDKSKDFLVQKGSDKLTIAFAGLPAGLSEVRHDFYNATSGMDCSKIWVKDSRAIWYQKGINDRHPSIQSVLTLLEENIKKLNPSYITCIGISAGGYAAHLFGSLLRVDRVESFGPQAFLSQEAHERAGIGEWLRVQRQRLYDETILIDAHNRRTWDLKNYMCVGKTQHNIHVCDKHPEDLIHARYLSYLPNVKIIEYNCTDHAPAAFLKRIGKLVDVLEGKYDCATSIKQSGHTV